MKTYAVGPEHPISRAEFEGEDEKFFAGMLPSGGADGSIIAKDDGEVVGWLRFYWDGRRKRFVASGTWVEPEYRSKRVAQALWARAMRTLKPKTVSVTTVTKEGRHLVGSIVRWFPRVNFEVRAA